MYTFVHRRQEINEILFAFKNVHKTMSKNGKIKEKLKNVIMNCCLFKYLTIGIYAFSCTVCFLYPFGYYLIFGVRVNHFGYVVPGVDFTRGLGYIINFCQHTIDIIFVV